MQPRDVGGVVVAVGETDGLSHRARQSILPAMALIEVPSGLEGVIAFDTSIAEPDKEGGALRYRGVDIEELVGNVPFEKVWGLLVDGQYEPGLPPAEPHPLVGPHRRPARGPPGGARDARARVGPRAS